MPMGSRARTMFFLDFTGGVKPYLLQRDGQPHGRGHAVEYAPSTRFYLDDQQRPETRWKTPLPFPVQVVARVEVIDDISGGKLTTEYRYHHGYWDGAEREFRGFGMVEQLDTETFDDYNAPGLHGAAVDFSPAWMTSTFLAADADQDLVPSGPDRRGVRRLGRGGLQSDEYLAGRPAGARARRQSSTPVFCKALAQRRAKRDALRALRGSILRTELYALDGTERAGSSLHGHGVTCYGAA